MKLLTTSKIDQVLGQFFKSEKQLLIPIKDNKGKSPTRCFTGIELERYRYPVQKIIDRILHYQKFKAKGLVNVNSNLFVNISNKQWNSLMPERQRITSMSILEALGMIIRNHNYAFKSPNLYGKSYPKSYRIDPDYYDQIVAIESVSLKDESNTIQGVSLKHDTNLLIKDNKSIVYCRCETPLKGAKNKVIDYITHNHHKLGVETSTITKSNITGWIYSSISGMERSLRNKIIEDHNLIDIDITRCHLLFILRLINECLSTGEYVPININAFKQELNAFNSDVINTDFYKVVEDDFDQLGLWTARDHKNSIIYNQKNSGKDYRKQKIKKVVMTWLASSRSDWKSIIHLNIKYPYISHFCKSYNQGTTNRLLNKLMSDEAGIVNGITEYMVDNYPTSISCSIYDGFIVDQDHAHIIYGLLKDRGTKYLGFEILLKTNKPITALEAFAPRQLPDIQSTVKVPLIKPVLTNKAIEPDVVLTNDHNKIPAWIMDLITNFENRIVGERLKNLLTKYDGDFRYFTKKSIEDQYLHLLKINSGDTIISHFDW